jgi:hypothetical protein
MLWVNVSAASVVELPLRALNWENGVRVCLLRKYVSLSALFSLGLYLCILIIGLGGRLLVLSSLFFLVSVTLLQWRYAIFWGGI